MLKILLVDEEPSLRELLSKLLEGSGGASVRVAESGREAIEILKDDPFFDVVVSELEMVDFSGLELWRMLRSNWPRISFALWTDSDNVDRAKLKGATFLGLYSKASLFDLVNTISRVSPARREDLLM